MRKYWREYYILFTYRQFGLQLINNWHSWRTDEWHLISFFRKWSNGYFNYYIAFLGFQLRFIHYSR